jgi:enamine deaminase RidA (YjgF/YER057c/UK114 family)
VGDGRKRVASGSPYEGPDGSCDPDPAAQARRCCDIIAAALDELGASLADVVRTRMFVTSADHADAVGAVHSEFFGDARPAATMVVVSALIDPRWKVEIEAEAVRPGRV